MYVFQVNYDNCNKWLHNVVMDLQTNNQYEQIKITKYYCIHCTYLRVWGTVDPQLDIAKKKLEFLVENLWVESQDSRAFSASN